MKFFFTILVFFCLLLPLHLMSQKSATDSLIRVIQLSKNDTQKIVLLQELTKYLERSFPDSALLFAKQAEYIALQIKHTDLLAENYKYIGNIYSRKDSFPAAQVYYEKALKIFDANDNKLGQAKIYNNLGALCRSQGKYVNALKNYHKSLELRKALNDQKGMGKTFNNIGNIHYTQGDYDLALKYYQQSLDIRKKYNDQLGIAGCYTNIGTIASKKHEPDKAIDFFQKSMEIYTKYNDKQGIGECYKRMALSNLTLNNLETAIENFEKALIYEKDLGDKFGEADSFIKLASAYNKKNFYEYAIKLANKGLASALELNAIPLQNQAYQQLSISYEALHNYKRALTFHKNFLQTKDSVFNINKTKELNHLEAKFQSEYQQLQIEQLKQENELKALKLKRYNGQRIMSFLIILVAFVIISGLFITRRRLQRKNRTIFEQREEILSQKEELEKHQNHLELIVQERTTAFLEAKEKAEQSDRLKTAFLANMSHEIRTPLNAIVGFSNLFALGNFSNEESEDYAKLIQSNSFVLINLINDIIDIAKIESGDFIIEISKVDIYNLTSEVFQSFEELLKIDETKQIKLQFEPASTTPVTTLTDDIRLRQVLNNLINNAIKFTDNGFVKVGYTFIKDFIEFFVQDTGIGIDEKDLETVFERFNKVEKNGDKFYRGTGIGLSISKHILKLLGGEIWVESELGKGSIFYFTIPIK